MPSMKAPVPTHKNASSSMGQALDGADSFNQWINAIPVPFTRLITTRSGTITTCFSSNSSCDRILENPTVADADKHNHIATKQHSIFQSIHTEDKPSFELSLVRASELPRLWEWEGRIVTSNDKIKWVSFTLQPDPYYIEADTICWNVSANDITPYKRKESEIKELNHLLSARLEARTAELAASQTRLQKLADNVPDLLYEMRLDSSSNVSFPYVSTDSYRLLNMSPEQFQTRGADMLNMVHEDERSRFKETIRESALTMKTYHYECRVVLPSGKTRWVRTMAKPQPQMDGSIIWYGCLSDISDRKQIEAQLNRSLKELADVKLALDYSSNVAITDHRGRITYTNDKFREISKYSQAELIGQTHRLVNSGYHPREFFDEMWHTISSGHIWIGEMKNKDKYNNHYWVYTTIVPFLTDEGMPYQYVAIHNDITERKRTELCLVQQAKDLEHAFSELQQTQTRLVQTEKMSSLGQLVAGIAHEINNPVNFIYGNVKPATRYVDSLVSLLKQYQHYYPNPPEEISEDLEDLDFDFITGDLLNLLSSIKLGSERIRQIVSSLRTFSRKDEAERKEVDIHDGLDSTLMILGHRLKEQQNRKAIAVEKEYSDLPTIFCYAGQLNQVFMNILSNAIDALETVQSPKLAISTAFTDGQLTICISDNGSGMSDKVRSQIFNPFYTTKPIGKGTGMGLSISYQIVTEKHSGSLICESDVGIGTTFTIQIPQAHLV